MCEQLHATEDAEHYRSALGQFTTGVAIVTSCNPQGKPVGMTINSFYWALSDVDRPSH